MIETRIAFELDRGVLIRGGKALCWHNWHIDVIEGVWRYRHCEKCDRRRADRTCSNLYGPMDWDFLETGEFCQPPLIPAPRERPAKPLTGREETG